MRKGVCTHVLLVFLACFAVSTVFRVALLIAALPAISQPGYLNGDDQDYDRLGVNLSRNHVFSRNLEDPSILDSRFTPGYPVLLALVYSMTGRSLVAVIAVQCVIGGLTCACLFLLARNYVRPAIAAAVAIAFGLEPHAAVGTLTIMTETVSALLLLLVCWLLLATTKRRSYGLASLTGLLVGVAALIRPQFMPVAAFLTGFLLVSALRGPGFRGKARRAGVLIALFCVTCSLPVVGWCCRNHVVFGHFQPTSNSGYYLATGVAAPMVCEIEGIPWSMSEITPILDDALGGRNWMEDGLRGPVPFDVSDELRTWSTGVIHAHPLVFAKLTARGCLDVLFSPHRGYYRDCLPAGSIANRLWAPSALLWWCAICFMAIGVAQWRALSGPPRAAVLLVMLVIAVILVTTGPTGIAQARYRVQFEPLVYLMAGIGLDALLRRRATGPVSLAREGTVRHP